MYEGYMKKFAKADSWHSFVKRVNSGGWKVSEEGVAVIKVKTNKL